MDGTNHMSSRIAAQGYHHVNYFDGEVGKRLNAYDEFYARALEEVVVSVGSIRTWRAKQRMRRPFDCGRGVQAPSVVAVPTSAMIPALLHTALIPSGNTLPNRGEVHQVTVNHLRHIRSKCILIYRSLPQVFSSWTLVVDPGKPFLNAFFCNLPFCLDKPKSPQDLPVS
jgi:hypothetical protein